MLILNSLFPRNMQAHKYPNPPALSILGVYILILKCYFLTHIHIY